MAQPRSEFLAGQLMSAPLEFSPNEFQPARLCAAKSFDSQSEPLRRMIRDGQHAPGEVELFGPQMQQRFFAASPHFPRHPRKGGNPAAVLVNVNEAENGEFLQTGLQFGGEIHTPDNK
jgi:hypothetical protein